MGICKSVFIATVVAIRDVVKNGFHCSFFEKTTIRVPLDPKLSKNKPPNIMIILTINSPIRKFTLTT